MTDLPQRERRASRPAMPLDACLAALPVLIGRLGHRFADPALLDVALTHPSWRNEQAPGQPDNQRLEFLGDAVLGLIITEALVQRMPERREGELTVLKSQLVRESSLADVAYGLHIGPALRLGRGEDQTGGRERPSVLADALEAVIGAVFLDAGYAPTRDVVLNLLDQRLAETIAQAEQLGPASPALSATTANWKTATQELLQHLGCLPPAYVLESEEGPVHARRFRVQATAQVATQRFVGHGEGYSKKSAEHGAAEALFRCVEAKFRQDPRQLPRTEQQLRALHDLFDLTPPPGSALIGRDEP